jgi:hypothetical protein
MVFLLLALNPLLRLQYRRGRVLHSNGIKESLYFLKFLPFHFVFCACLQRIGLVTI